MPPDPSGRSGRYRSRKRSFAAAGEDTLRSYGFSRAFPLLAEPGGRFGPSNGHARRRPRIRFLRGARDDGGPVAIARTAAAPWRSGARRAPSVRAAARPDTAVAPARSDRDPDRGARVLRPADPVVRLDVEARHVQELHGE